MKSEIIVAIVVLVVFSSLKGKPLHVVSFSVYGSTLCLLYLSSAVYHFFCRTDKYKAIKFLQKVDHCAIYLLIAGSYTPLCLIVLKGIWGWSLFGSKPMSFYAGAAYAYTDSNIDFYDQEAIMITGGVLFKW